MIQVRFSRPPSPHTHCPHTVTCMPPGIRQQHNSLQLECLLGCRKWFKTTGGRTKHMRSSFHSAEAAMRPRRPSHTHNGLNPDEAIHSPPPEDTISYASSQNTPRSRLSTPDVPHGGIPMFDNPPFNNHPFFNDDPLFNDDPFINDNPFINDDPFINDNPPLNEPFARSPARNESPLQDEISIYHHPLINGAYTVIISCVPMFKLMM